MGTAVFRFPNWWFGELAGLVPRGLKRLFRPQRKWIVLDFSGPELVVSRGPSGRLREVGRADSSGDRAGQRRLVRRLNPRSGTVVLRLADTHALRKVISLPLAAEENLRQVLSFEMDRHTPFNTNEVNFDFRVLSREPEHQRLRVELTVMPRAIINQSLTLLGEWGLSPQVVEIAGGAASEIGAINLIPPEAMRTSSRGVALINTLLALIATTLIGAVIFLVVERQDKVAAIMAERVDSAKDEAEKVVALREKLERLTADGGFLRERKRNTPTVTEIVNELTRVLRDDTWVHQLRINDGEVWVTGYSDAASETIALIDASPRFKEVTFRSPVTQDARLGLERFHLSAKLEAMPSGEPQG